MRPSLRHPTAWIPFQASPPPLTKGRAGARAFTLLEILVSVAVLSLMMVFLAKAIGTMGSTWQKGLQRINNFTKARAMLDLLTNDIQAGVFRSDLAAFPNSAIAFYTLRPGIGGTRQLSLVQYAINTSDDQSTLQRGDLAEKWDSTISFGSTNDFGGASPTARDTASGVVGFELIFVQKDGSLSRAYSTSTNNPSVVVAVTLAVVDDQANQQLSSLHQATQLRGALKSAVSGTRSIRADWESYLASGLSWKSYPASLGTGLKIFERYVPLPVSH